MKAMIIPQQNRLTSENLENCVKLKVTKYVADIEQLAKTMQNEISQKIQIIYFIKSSTSKNIYVTLNLFLIIKFIKKHI